METSLPTPMTARVYVNLLEGNYWWIIIMIMKSWWYTVMLYWKNWSPWKPASLSENSGARRNPLVFRQDNPGSGKTDEQILLRGLTSLLVLSREFSGIIHNNYINNNPSNPQQPIHSLRLAPVSIIQIKLLLISTSDTVWWPSQNRSKGEMFECPYKEMSGCQTGTGGTHLTLLVGSWEIARTNRLLFIRKCLVVWQFDQKTSENSTTCWLLNRTYWEQKPVDVIFVFFFSPWSCIFLIHSGPTWYMISPYLYISPHMSQERLGMGDLTQPSAFSPHSAHFQPHQDNRLVSLEDFVLALEMLIWLSSFFSSHETLPRKHGGCTCWIYLVGGDWNHGIWWLFIFWEFHHPNWRTPSFFKGVGQPPTRLSSFRHHVTSSIDFHAAAVSAACVAPVKQLIRQSLGPSSFIQNYPAVSWLDIHMNDEFIFDGILGYFGIFASNSIPNPSISSVWTPISQCRRWERVSRCAALSGMAMWHGHVANVTIWHWSWWSCTTSWGLHKHDLYGFVWKWLVPHCTQWFCWSLSLLKNCYFIRGIPHFQTYPYMLTAFQVLRQLHSIDSSSTSYRIPLMISSDSTETRGSNCCIDMSILSIVYNLLPSYQFIFIYIHIYIYILVFDHICRLVWSKDSFPFDFSSQIIV